MPIGINFNVATREWNKFNCIEIKMIFDQLIYPLINFLMTSIRNQNPDHINALYGWYEKVSLKVSQLCELTILLLSENTDRLTPLKLEVACLGVFTHSDSHTNLKIGSQYYTTLMTNLSLSSLRNIPIPRIMNLIVTIVLNSTQQLVLFSEKERYTERLAIKQIWKQICKHITEFEVFMSILFNEYDFRYIKNFQITHCRCEITKRHEIVEPIVIPIGEWKIENKG